MSRYAAEADDGQKDRLQKEHQRINDLLMTNRDPSLLSSLHQYRFLTLIVLHRDDVLNDELFEQALTSYFHIQAKGNPHVRLDVETMHELQRAKRYFQDLIKQKTKIIDPDMIKDMIRPLNPDFSLLALSGSGLEWTLNNPDETVQYTVDVEQGSIFKANKKYSSIPFDLYKTQLLKELGLENETSCLISPNGNIIECMTPDGHVKFIRSPGNTFIIQKEFTLQSMKRWYQLQPFSEQQKHQLQLSSPVLVNHALPAILVDGSITAWQQCDGVNAPFILTQQDKPVYYTENSQLKTWHGQTLTNDPTTSRLDSPGFVLTRHDQGLNSKSVHFERYGLVLKQEGATFVHAARPSFVLQSMASFPLMPDVACLSFKETQIEKNVRTERDYVVVPVQPFYRNGESTPVEGDFFQFKHDTSNHVATEQLKSKWDKEHLELNKRPLWRHQNTCRTITYAMINGKPKPDKASDGLYLAYLYLAEGLPHLAWDVLQDIHQRFPLEGSYEELSYLEWIVHALPVALDKNDEAAVREMPQYGACQLQALSLLTLFLARDKKPIFPLADAVDLSTANGHYDALRIEQVTQLYSNLSSTVVRKLNAYFSTKRHLVYPCVLDEATRQSLLNYTSSTCSDTRGALGYQQCASGVAILSQELRLLEENITYLAGDSESTQFTPMDLLASEHRFASIHQEVGHKKRDETYLGEGACHH